MDSLQAALRSCQPTYALMLLPDNPLQPLLPLFSNASAYGEISVKWEKTEKGYQYVFVVPANTTATLILPAPEEGEYAENGPVVWYTKEGMTLLENDGEKVKYELLAGTYSIITE